MEPVAYSLGININTWAQWLRLLLGLILVFGLFHWSADVLRSDRGQAGLIVGALVVSATLFVERILFGQRVRSAARALGIGRPRAKGLLVSSGICLLLLLVIPLFVQSTGAAVHFFPGWITLIPGLFAQAGIAEETLFRGYLFGHVRLGRSFWRAAGLSTLPFVSVHLLLFVSMPRPIALAAVALAVLLSFPLAHLFELGGHTMWAPALLHFVVQGSVKVVVISGDAASLFPLLWMAVSALFLSSFYSSHETTFLLS